MSSTDGLQGLAIPSTMGVAALAGAPWQLVVPLVAVLLVHRYLRHRERLRELDVAERAIDRSDTDRLPELMSTVYHAAIDSSETPRRPGEARSECRAGSSPASGPEV